MLGDRISYLLDPNRVNLPIFIISHLQECLVVDVVLVAVQELVQLLHDFEDV